MDLLSDILGDLRVASTLYCRFAVGAGAGLAYPAAEAAGFHLVTEGALVLRVDGGAPIALTAGDFVIVAHGNPHRIQAAGTERAEPVAGVAARAVDGAASVGTGPPVGRFLCGAFHFGAAGDHPLLRALPTVIHVRAEPDRPTQPWLAAHLDAVACELRSGRPGAQAVIGRLSEVLFVHALRHHLADRPDAAEGWLGALRDPQLAQAVGLLHRHPERGWTVAGLAREVGLSRSHFAERFAATVGRPPLTYLAEWRMHRSRALLREGTLNVGEVARRVGYGSEAAFGTAFRRASGMAPGAYRRRAVSV